MKKKVFMVLRILYYVFTFGLGLLIALVLPSKYIEEYQFQYVNEKITDAEYTKALNLLVYGMYSPTECYKSKDLSIYPAYVISKNEDEKPADDTKFEKVYYLFFNYIDSSLFKQKTDNKAQLSVDGKKYQILSYDSNNDDENDSVATLVNFNYILVTLYEKDYSSIQTLDLIDKTGATYRKYENLSLNFDEEFYTDSENLVTKYDANNNYAGLEDDLNLLLDKGYKRGLEKNSDMKKIEQRGQNRATIFILVYFAWIYILGDILVGYRFIPRFFKFIYLKIRKKKEDQVNKEEVLGSDYFTQLKIEATVPEEFDQDIIIIYNNSVDDIKFVLDKKSNYQKTFRTHAGNYLLSVCTIDGYEVEGLPKNLNVNGYRMNLNIKVVKK